MRGDPRTPHGGSCRRQDFCAESDVRSASIRADTAASTACRSLADKDQNFRESIVGKGQVISVMEMAVAWVISTGVAGDFSAVAGAVPVPAVVVRGAGVRAGPSMLPSPVLSQKTSTSSACARHTMSEGDFRLPFS